MEMALRLHPGMEPGQDRSGTAVDFDHARSDFEAAWRRILPTLSEANFQEWRHDRDWIAWKCAMHAANMKLPSRFGERAITMLLRRFHRYRRRP
jgi:hypothetical protein